MWPARGVLARCWGDGVKSYDGALQPINVGAVMKAGDYVHLLSGEAFSSLKKTLVLVLAV